MQYKLQVLAVDLLLKLLQEQDKVFKKLMNRQ